MTTAQHERTTPVYVDLDGTLISSDMLWESLCLLLRHRPFDVLRMPIWLSKGKAHLKSCVAERVESDASALPYRPEVLAYLREQRAQGREIVLATASHRSIAESIAAHLGLFDDVIATADGENLRGENKLEEIQTHAAGRPFEYLGNSSADLPVWAAADLAVIVAPHRGVAARAAALDVAQTEIATPPSSWKPLFGALRSHQWAKNGLLFLPLLLAHQITNPAKLASVGITFACFSAIASATYLLNDLLDIESDRQHPRKRKRPFAAGTLSVPSGFVAMGVLHLLGFGTALLTVGPDTAMMLAIYFALTTAYSFYLKSKQFIDVLMLAGLYTLRVLTGGVAGEVTVSPWLLAFSTFFFLSLALVKRYVELLSAKSREASNLVGRRYEVEDIHLVETMGITSGYMAVLVLCLYVSSDAVAHLYPNPAMLWLALPFLLYWITRMWFLARRGSIPDDPVLFAVTDRISYWVVLIIAGVGVLAAWSAGGIGS